MPRPKAPGLMQVNVRLLKQDIETAKKEARVLAVPYQHIVRKWVADAAEGIRKAKEAGKL